MVPPKADPAPPVESGPVTLAAIIGAHGVAGEVRLKVFADDLSPFTRFNDGALTLTSLRPGNNGAIARFAEIRDRNAAEAMRGTTLTVPRSELPPLAEGEYYHADLIGLPAVTPTGEPLGTVVAVDNFGAGDVIEVERPTGKRFMVPMRPEAVPEWSPERMVIEPDFAA
ncbi:ribosome maturation factor RimM [Sphingomonas sp. S-NIH.Pt15_0812]|jgi:16S rRNA processing protein RimM|uniref:ribosome maturation factor RimM n=1 Tax=Sphingomonas sp. S-NIH.Pt15_0812 TaxID=1920129 RepID=UPI000F7F8457|nr:ribosome maturation factor RimM [Sphingomonas sp. S-NIH.Pt15_0812]RSU54682.1 16S rRNA processing protein RimM [Sphingomonas sp. S-NIH.Pt15_0812]